jgi:hypothetical protein
MLPWRPIALGTAAVVLAMLVGAVLGSALPSGAAAADTPRLPPLDLGPIAPPLPDQPSVPLALARGWAVAVTDYEGLGTPGEHTYTVAVCEGRAALDIARAAMRVPGAGLSEHAPVALWGYSQGGGAAASAGEQATHYTPELRTVGVAEGGVPSDLRAVLAGVDGGAGFALLAGATAGFDTAPGSVSTGCSMPTAVGCSRRSGTSAPRSSPPTPATTSTSTPGSPGC